MLSELQPLEVHVWNGVRVRRLPCAGYAFDVWPHGIAFEPVQADARETAAYVLAGLDPIEVQPRTRPPREHPGNERVVPRERSVPWHSQEQAIYRSVSGPLTIKELLQLIRAVLWEIRLANERANRSESADAGTE